MSLKGIAKETLSILDANGFATSNGEWVSLGAEQKAVVQNTRLLLGYMKRIHIKKYMATKALFLANFTLVGILFKCLHSIYAATGIDVAGLGAESRFKTQVYCK